MKNKCFIGLGVMGYPIAGHISQGGYKVSVFNRSKEKSKAWILDYSGRLAGSPAEAAEGCDMAFLCVGKDSDVEEVILGDNSILESICKGGTIIDHTTTSAKLARKLEKECLKKEVFFIDAPVSGGELGAKQGSLTIMAGGSNKAFMRSKKVMDLYSKYCKRMGKSGAGQLTKMVNQICIAGLLQGLAEGMDFSEKAGLSTKKVIEVISKGAAQSWQMQNRWETMLNDQYEHGFKVDWMRKDLAIALEEASENGSDLKIAELIDSFYSEIQDLGGGKWDTSSLFWLLQQK
tara:strand:- start:83 stop:952 length:870 start_codon:yes stop_codon:yes gene_type:complete